MDYILDTCALLDLHLDPESVSDDCRSVILTQDKLNISGFSFIEISQKVSTGKLNLKCQITDWFEKAVPPELISTVEISPEIAVEAYNLPGDFHKDPADRIIVATARVKNLTIITSDFRILEYPHVNSLQSRKYG